MDESCRHSAEQNRCENRSTACSPLGGGLQQARHETVNTMVTWGQGDSGLQGAWQNRVWTWNSGGTILFLIGGTVYKGRHIS